MRKLFKKLWNDKRGNALIIFGASLPMIMGAAGLASDTIQWALWKRQLQRAADSAAFAGVYARAQGDTSISAEQAVAIDLSKNNTTKITLKGGYPQIAYPTPAGVIDAVRVTLAVQKKLGFSSLFISTPPTITTSATAALVEAYNYCAIARATTGPGIIIAGSTDVDLGCGAIAHSTDGINAVDVNGTGHTFRADPVAAVGGIDGTINGSPNLQPNAMEADDPYAGLSTNIPSGESCTNFNHPSKSNPNGTMKPGCYNSFNLGGGTVTLSPGTYYLNSTSLQLTGHERLLGNGVTLIFTGSTPGTISMSGNSSMDLTAPTAGTFANMLMIQSGNAEIGNNNTINGDNNTALDGVIYFPNGDLTFSGSSSGATQCAMIVGWTLTFQGDAEIQNDVSDCDAATQVRGRKVRLIA